MELARLKIQEREKWEHNSNELREYSQSLEAVVVLNR